jgi:hypothetical protein
MTLVQVIARIVARGFAVITRENSPHAKYAQCNVALDVTSANGANVAWPNFAVVNGKVTDVAVGSFHGVKGSGLTSVEIAAIYGDMYLIHKPAQAERLLTALLLAPAPAPVVITPQTASDVADSGLVTVATSATAPAEDTASDVAA